MIRKNKIENIHARIVIVQIEMSKWSFYADYFSFVCLFSHVFDMKNKSSIIAICSYLFACNQRIWNFHLSEPVPLTISHFHRPWWMDTIEKSVFVLLTTYMTNLCWPFSKRKKERKIITKQENLWIKIRSKKQGKLSNRIQFKYYNYFHWNFRYNVHRLLLYYFFFFYFSVLFLTDFLLCLLLFICFIIVCVDSKLLFKHTKQIFK